MLVNLVEGWIVNLSLPMLVVIHAWAYRPLSAGGVRRQPDQFDNKTALYCVDLPNLAYGVDESCECPDFKPQLLRCLNYSFCYHTFMAISQNTSSELDLPWHSETISEVRTGKIKPLSGLPDTSAIFKNPRQGPIKLGKLGLEGDQQAYEFSGGPDRALLQYNSTHYDAWASELPASAHLFNLGGFGENLTAKHANERNLCIGDVISIGKTVVVQVSLPRQPCFKLNHRFQIKDIARRSQELSRTGWFYRILQEGYIEAGDVMMLVERKNSKWTIAKVQHYLYVEVGNLEAMKELVELESLGAESKTIFANRLKRNIENQKVPLVGDKTGVLDLWADYRLKDKRHETSRISSFLFEAVDPLETPMTVQPGSHVRVKLGNNLVRAYSVVAGDTNVFELGVSLDRDFSKGGSLYLHDKLKECDVLSVSNITSSFPLSVGADEHILIAGGVGITALVAAARKLEVTGESYHLHYLVRESREIAFSRYLGELGKNVTIYDKSVNKTFDVMRVVAEAGDNSHVYCCGPDRLMVAVADAATQSGLSKKNVHFEAFETLTSGDPFSAELAGSKMIVEVGSTQTLLEVLRDAGLDVPSSCEAGSCGTCKIDVRSGRTNHRGTGLQENERRTAILSCVSRGVGKIVLDF